MRNVLSAAVIAVLAVSALSASPSRAQMSTGKEKTPLDLQYEAERKQQEENERAYNDTMKRLKSQAPTATSSDPWRTVRPKSDGAAKR